MNAPIFIFSARDLLIETAANAEDENCDVEDTVTSTRTARLSVVLLGVTAAGKEACNLCNYHIDNLLRQHFRPQISRCRDPRKDHGQ